MPRCVQDYVENVVSAKKHVTVVGKHLLIFILSCSFEKDVHVSIDFNHLAFVFTAVLEDDFDVSVKLLDQDVERFFAGFHHGTVVECIGMHNPKNPCEI